MVLDVSGLIILFTSGLLAVTLIDVIGSISSRRLNYKYVYLTPLSFIVYSLVGYYGYYISTFMWTLVIACMVGIYDGTIGWKLSILLKANLAEKSEYTESLKLSSRVLAMIMMSGFFGLLGFVIAGLLTKHM